jgi:flagellar motility protein MotE (MotC chaperone)
MLHALDELRKSLRYHTRQLEENKQEIIRKEESIALLQEKNKVHEDIVEELQKAIELIQG